MKKTIRPGRHAFMAFTTAVILVAGSLALGGTSGATGPNGIGGNFEIDANANLVQDDVDTTTPPYVATGIDWLQTDRTTLTAGVMVDTDTASGSGDESFGQGTKEDTEVPTVTDGSIPPNKSDLKSFGLYIEAGRYLNLFWTRVQDPEGTTNMDFEFNQSTTLSANNMTPIRSTDDFLITYDLSKGGTVPTISVRKWLVSDKWGPATAITGQNQALASINTSIITAANSDGVGPLDPRTFGEASIDLEAVFGNSCGRIGAAFLKSRSSDSFTSAVKDFVPPNLDVNFNNCPPAAPTTTHRVFLSDEGTVGSLGYPGTLTFELYFKAETDTTSLPCATANKVTTPTSYAGIAVSTAGFAATPSNALYAATADGLYSWIVTYAPGTGSQLLAGSSACSSEQVKVDRTP